jgi:hypothetical protein
MTKILGIGILAILFTLIFSLALAQESSPLAPSGSPIPNNKIEYTLPYPGILPDHPLYFVKTLRDTILSRLISNPVKMAEFDLLQADKKLNMSIFLKMKQNAGLMHKINEESVGHLKEVDRHIFAAPISQYPEINSLKDRFEQSLKKHIEEFEHLKEGLGQEDQTKVDQIISETEKILNDFTAKR